MSEHRAVAAQDLARLSPGDPRLAAWAAPEECLGLEDFRQMSEPCLWPSNLKRGRDGEMCWYGVPVTSLLAGGAAGSRQPGPEVKTPVFMLDLDEFRLTCESVRDCFEKSFSKRAQVHYAGKALLTYELAKIAAAAGLGLDTASAGELTLALAAGCKPELIGLHGNGKSEELLHYAVSAGIGRIILDSVSEVLRLQRVLDEFPQAYAVPVMLRITTGVHAGGHDFIATAHEDQKFGLSLTPGAVVGLSPEAVAVWGVDPSDSPAMAATKLVLADERLHLLGLHSHIGSQIVGLDGFEAAARVALEFRAEIQRETGYLVEELDLGGGYGVSYVGSDPVPPAVSEVAQGLYRTVQSVCTELEQPLPFISIEPGRSLVAPAVVTLYRVVNIKDQPVGERENGAVLYRRYVTVDGGMSDNIRPALYGSNYTAALANRTSDADLVACRVVGSHCESGDIVIHNVALPEDLDEGDLLAVPMTGAYGWSMSSNYNWFTRRGVLGIQKTPSVPEDMSPFASSGTEAGISASTHWLLEPETVDSMLTHFDPGYREYLAGKLTALEAASGTASASGSL